MKKLLVAAIAFTLISGSASAYSVTAQALVNTATSLSAVKTTTPTTLVVKTTAPQVATVKTVSTSAATPSSAALTPIHVIGTPVPTPIQLCITSGPFRTSPWIHVTSPSGGQTYISGQQITVTYSDCNLPSNVTIKGAISWPSNFTAQPSYSLPGTVANPNTGSFSYTLPAQNLFSAPNTFQYGNYYSMLLIATTGSGPSLAQTSSNTFTINASNTNSSTSTTTSSSSTTTTAVCNSVPIISAHGTPTVGVTSSGGSSQHQVGVYTIPVAITAPGCDQYIPSTATVLGLSSGTHDRFGILENGNTVLVSAASQGQFIYTGSSNAGIPTSNGNYKIPAGQTEDFNLVVAFTPQSAGNYAAYLSDIPASTIDATQFTGIPWLGYASNPTYGASGYMSPGATLQ